MKFAINFLRICGALFGTKSFMDYENCNTFEIEPHCTCLSTIFILFNEFFFVHVLNKYLNVI